MISSESPDVSRYEHKNRIRSRTGKLLCEEIFYYDELQGKKSAEEDLLSLFACGECIWQPGYVLRGSGPHDPSLSFVCSGACEITGELNKTILQAGELAVFNRRSSENIRAVGDEPFRKKVLILNRTPFLAGIMDLLFPGNVSVIRLDGPEEMESFFDRILQSFRQGTVSSAENGVLLFRLLQKLKRNTAAPKYSSVLQQILRRIHETPYLRITREELARFCGMSLSSLNRIFQKEMNCTPGQYILNARFERAGRYLACMTMPVKQVAIECGFPDQKYFSREFHRRFGVSPSEYRKKSPSP